MPLSGRSTYRYSSMSCSTYLTNFSAPKSTQSIRLLLVHVTLLSSVENEALYYPIFSTPCSSLLGPTLPQHPILEHPPLKVTHHVLQYHSSAVSRLCSITALQYHGSAVSQLCSITALQYHSSVQFGPCTEDSNHSSVRRKAEDPNILQ
jgi:hypothetical protein